MAAGSIALQAAPGVFGAFGLFCLALPMAAYAQGAGWPRSVLLAGITLGLLWAASRPLLGRGRWAPRRLQWDAAGQFSLVLADGSVEPVQLQAGSLASSRWLWLVLRGRHQYHLFLDRQRADPGAFAAIRRRLRTFTAPASL